MKTENSSRRVGVLSCDVIRTLGITAEEGAPICIGETNIDHMKRRHPSEYEDYGDYIPLILRDPDYVGVNPKDRSIEYVREFCISGEFVKVAVRVSVSGVYFVRSLYILREDRVKNFIQKDRLKPLDKMR